MITGNIDEQPIFSLNRHCFFAIFDCLNFRDQYYFAQTCKRIQEEFCSYLYWSQKLISFDEIPKEEIKDIFNFLIKNNVKTNSLQASGHSCNEMRNDLLYKLVKHYPNLIELKLSNFKIFSDLALKKLLKSFTNLKVLSLIRCELNDVHCLYLRYCTMIEKLDLSENYVITGKYLDAFPNLVDLNLNYCGNIKPIFFIMLCKVSKLKRLHIAFCNELNEITFRGMVKHLPEVSTLTLSTMYRCKKLHILTKLAKLKNLELHGICDLKQSFYDQLLEHKGCTLERLEFICSNRDKKICKRRYGDEELLQPFLEPIFSLSNIKYLSIKYLELLNDKWLEKIAGMDSLIYLNFAGCQKITHDGIISMIIRLENLRELDLSMCIQLSPSFREELNSRLKSVNNRRRIIVHAGQTKLLDKLNKNNEMNINSEAVQLSSHVSFPVEHVRHAHFRKPSHSLKGDII